jgi:hypothetical protein
MPTLPFLSMATVTRNGEPVSTTMPISIWPAGARVADVGGVYDHEAEAPIIYAEALAMSNVRVTVDEIVYTVVDAQAQPFLPHVALQLRQVRSGGI